MPFTYRALDAGHPGIDLRTLVDASRSLRRRLGARRCSASLVPNMRAPLLIASAFLTATVVLGRVHDGLARCCKQTLPIFLVELSGQSAAGSALACLAMLVLPTRCCSVVITRSPSPPAASGVARPSL